MLFSKVAKVVLFTGWLTYRMSGPISSPVGPKHGKLSLGIARAGSSLNGDCYSYLQTIPTVHCTLHCTPLTLHFTLILIIAL